MGLTETEAVIFLTLLKNNRLTSSAIGRLTGLKRTTIYSAADELCNKGIIQKDETSGVIYYLLIDPSNLENLIQSDKRKVRQKEKVLKSVSDDLEKIPRANGLVLPKVRMVYGDEIYSFMRQRLSIWDKSAVDIADSVQWGFQDDSIFHDEKIIEIAKWYWKNTPKSMSLKMFGNNRSLNDSLDEKVNMNLSKQRQFKFVDNLPFTANQWVWGEYIINYVCSEKPHYLIEIRDRLMADNLRILYKKIWEEN